MSARLLPLGLALTLLSSAHATERILRLAEDADVRIAFSPRPTHATWFHQSDRDGIAFADLVRAQCWVVEYASIEEITERSLRLRFVDVPRVGARLHYWNPVTNQRESIRIVRDESAPKSGTIRLDQVPPVSVDKPAFPNVQPPSRLFRFPATEGWNPDRPGPQFVRPSEGEVYWISRTADNQEWWSSPRTAIDPRPRGGIHQSTAPLDGRVSVIGDKVAFGTGRRLFFYTVYPFFELRRRDRYEFRAGRWEFIRNELQYHWVMEFIYSDMDGNEQPRKRVVLGTSS